MTKLLSDDAGAISFRAVRHGDAPPLDVACGGGRFRARQQGATVADASVSEDSGALRLMFHASPTLPGFLAVAEAASVLWPDAPHVIAGGILDPHLRADLQRAGLILPEEGGSCAIVASAVWQQRAPWLAGAAAAPFPERTDSRAPRPHPVRPAKPEGVVYARYIPWLDRILTLRAMTASDLKLFHRWMNDPAVDQFWNDRGDEAAHRRMIEERIADPHALPLIAAFDGDPFGYFEVYWAAENRLGAHYDAESYDRGWHVAIGEERYRGRAFISAWLPSILHYQFLDDPRTRRIVGEPASRHVQQLRNLERSGFRCVKEFDFPHKRATLVMLERAKFFGERLWNPDGDPVRARAVS